MERKVQRHKLQDKRLEISRIDWADLTGGRVYGQGVEVTALIKSLRRAKLKACSPGGFVTRVNKPNSVANIEIFKDEDFLVE